MQCVDRWGIRGFGSTDRDGSRLRRLAIAAALLVAMLLVPTVGTAYADEFGYCTVSGVGGVAEDARFETLSAALGAVNSCDPSLQAEGSSVAIVVHGMLSVDVQEAETGVFEFSFPAAGASCSVVGSGGSRIDAYDSAGSGRPLAISNASGSLAVRGISVGYPLTLSSGGSLAVEGCAFESSVTCGSWGSVVVSDSRFTAWEPSPSAAVSVSLLAPGATFSFSNNQVDSHAVGVACSVVDATSHASFVQNSFALDGTAVDTSLTTPCAVLLEGGPWGPASITYQDNAFSSNAACSTFVLGSSCLVAESHDPAVPAQSVADDTLTAAAVSLLFDQQPIGSSDVAVSLDPSRGDCASAAEVWSASQLLLGVGGDPAADATASVTVSYDANGATAGVAPEPVQLEPGQSTTVSHMGSLVNTGYVFEGWSTEPDGSGSFYAVGQVILPEADMVLYAQWAPTGTVGTYAVTLTDAPAAGLELEAA